jgi:branched-chain amino acid aminotransferase
MRQIWWNGKILPESEARVSIYDSALCWGDMIFEMTRSFNHKHFKLREHLERLVKSARYVHIPIGMDIDSLEKACHQVTEANPFPKEDEHRLMINVTRGLLPVYAETGEVGTNVIISDFPLRWTTKGMGKLFNTGIRCQIPSQRAIPSTLLEPKVKNRSRLHYKMAMLEVGDGKWPLMLDPDGFIAELPGANFFIIKNASIITPEGRNVLRGISRQFIGEMYEIEERNIEPYDVYEADEAFVTGTPFCMLPVTSLNNILIGDGEVGYAYKAILADWSKRVKVEIKEQIQKWDEVDLPKEANSSTHSFDYCLKFLYDWVKT